MLAWAEESQVPAAVLLTKADKLNRVTARTLEHEVVQRLGLPVLLFSTPQRQGVEDARGWISKWLGPD